MKNKFIKMHGLGNDFAVFDMRQQSFAPTREQIRALANRHCGIGFDQLVVIDHAKSGQADAFMHLYNADGGQVSACGNATRCVAWLLANELKKKEILIETHVEILKCSIAGDFLVTVDMGVPKLDWQDIPLANAQDTSAINMHEAGMDAPVGVNMGNPHAVFFVADVGGINLSDMGPRVENHPLFPERTNVEIAQVLAPDHIRMRVWERGVGITQACGTGACAVAVAAVRREKADRNVTVTLDGGDLHIHWRADTGRVLMTGPVAVSFYGEIDL